MLNSIGMFYKLFGQLVFFTAHNALELSPFVLALSVIVECRPIPKDLIAILTGPHFATILYSILIRFHFRFHLLFHMIISYS